MASFYISILLSPLLLLSFVAATCYNPDGTVVNDSAYQPCVFTAGVISMCCATNRRQSNADSCLSNGLCHNPCKNKTVCDDGTGGQYWRESCTDPSWKSPFCLRACTDPSTGWTGNFAMSQCSTDGSWCCGRGLTSEACCATNIKDRIVLADTVGVSSSTTNKSLTASSAMSTGLTTGLTFSPDSGPTSALSLMPTSTTPASHSDTGKKAGIGAGVGTGVGVLTVAAIVAFFLLRRRLGRGRRQSSDDVSELSGAGSNDTTHYNELAVPGRQNQELDTHRTRAEVERPELQGVNATTPHEMPATRFMDANE